MRCVNTPICTSVAQSDTGVLKNEFNLLILIMALFVLEK